MESFGVDIAVLDIDWGRIGDKVTAYGSSAGVRIIDGHANIEWEFESSTCPSKYQP